MQANLEHESYVNITPITHTLTTNAYTFIHWPQSVHGSNSPGDRMAGWMVALGKHCSVTILDTRFGRFIHACTILPFHPRLLHLWLPIFFGVGYLGRLCNEMKHQDACRLLESTNTHTHNLATKLTVKGFR